MTGYEPLVDGFLPGSAAGGRGAGTAAIGRPVIYRNCPMAQSLSATTGEIA